MIISKAWCSEARKPGEEMFSNTGFAVMAGIGNELKAWGLVPTSISRAEFTIDTVYRCSHYRLTVEATHCELRQEFWQWLLQNKPKFKQVRSAAELQDIEDETQMDPVKLLA